MLSLFKLLTYYMLLLLFKLLTNNIFFDDVTVSYNQLLRTASFPQKFMRVRGRKKFPFVSYPANIFLHFETGTLVV